MSWESSLEYYRLINEETKTQLGDTHSSNCLMYSFDFDEVEKLQHQGKWDELTTLMVDEASNLKNAGAEFIVICTNTMHKMANAIEEGTNLEVLHIARVTGDAIVNKGIKKVGLLGTKFTMEGTFYRDIIQDEFNVEVLVPNPMDREVVHNIIYDKLIKGLINETSRSEYVRIIENLRKQGCEGVILGCTEIPLLIKEKDSPIPIFDTTTIHAKAAVLKAIK
jgi:aspartate racemase